MNIKSETGRAVADVLMHYIDAGELKRSQIASIARTSEPTLCRWLSPDEPHEPSSSQLAILVKRLPAIIGDALIAKAFPQYSHDRIDWSEEALDIDHDGHADLDDAIDLSIEGDNTLSVLMEQVRVAERQGMTPQRRAAIQEYAIRMKQAAGKLYQIATEAGELTPA